MKRNTKTKVDLKKKAINALKTVIDPEIGASVLDLGLIYDLKVEKDSVKVLMTLTSIGCPLRNFIIAGIENKLKEVGFKNVAIELTFDPPWTPERMSKELRKKLGI